MTNTDVFNAATMEIFHECSVNFPRSTEIETVALTQVVLEYFEVLEDDSELNDLFSEIEETIFSTIVWLKDEGYLKDTWSNDNSFVVVLTQKGLNAINATPNVLDKSSSFKDYFIQGLTNLPFTTVSGVMVDFFKSGS